MKPRTSRTNKQGKRIANPGSFNMAKALSEKFHGRVAGTVTTVVGRIKFNKNIAELGDLEGFWVLPPGVGNKALRIPFDPDKVRLTSNPQGDQLLVSGLTTNATTIDLGRIPWLVEGELTKQLVGIGEIFQVDYYTDKHHLEGPETQKDGSGYGHIFGKKSGIRPLLVYDRLNKSCLLIGGDYSVEDIGIVG